MDSDEDTLEMQLLQEQSPSAYQPLLHLLQKRHLATFKSLVRRALSRQPASIDVNQLIGYPTNKTFLDMAASDNLPEFVAFLLEVGAEPNLVNDEFKRAPIHFAAEAGNAEALQVLLQDPRIKPNLEGARLTALHYAVKANCEQCARLLLEAGASPNIPNSRGITALHQAAEKNLRGMVQLIVEYSKLLDLDSFRDRRGQTTRMLIQSKFPDIALPEESAAPDPAILLRYHLSANDEIKFLKTLETIEEPISNRNELLRMAVEHNLRDATAALMKTASIDSTLFTELARIAVEQGHPDILKELLSRSPKMADHLLMPASRELGIPTRPGPGNRNNRFECLRMVLMQDVDVRQEDDKGNSPLHYAARAECREAVELLLRKGCYIGHMNRFGVPPLAHIAPSILQSQLDECLTSSNERTEEYEIIMDYRNLVPHNTQCGEEDYFEKHTSNTANGSAGNPCSETEALLYIADDKNLRHLLKHPLLASFLYLKYLRIRHVLYLNFLLYLIFFILLNWYIWLVVNDDLESEAAKGNSTSVMSTENEENGNGVFGNWIAHPVHSALLALSLCYMILRECMQLLSSPLHYVISPENWLELCLIGMTVGLLFGAGHEIGAIAILLSTWELVILMAQHPRMSTDIEMFKTVTVNFTKFLFLYIFLILAFALSFFVLFRGDDNFPNPYRSLFKTIVMLTGEFDSSDLPFLSYPILSRLIFIGFIFLIVIILLNLLNGLAVNDTAEILSEAELVCLISRARLVAYAERIAVGSPFVPKTQLCCCVNYLPFQSLTTSPVRFIARRILLFPRYLPQARLSVKFLKSYEITLHGRQSSGSRCSTLKMDPIVAHRAKEILAARDRESAEDKILAQLSELNAKFESFERGFQEIRAALRNNNEGAEENEAPLQNE